MIHPIRAWNAFFFRPISARPLGLIRILFGLVALFNLALCAVDLDYWYTDAGLLQGNEAWVVAGGLQPSILQFYQDPITVRVFFVLTAAAAFFLTIGWRTRLMSILFYIGMLSIHNRNLVTSSGADVLLIIYTFNLMLCPCGAAYSVDAWLASRKRGTLAEPVIIPWSFRLIQIQSSIVYALAAGLKCGGDLWVHGSALHFVLNNTEVTRFNLGFLSAYPPLINVMTYMAVAMEFSLAFFIWFRVTRPLVILMGFMLHTGITITINIPIFAELMWIGYIAFLTPTELDAVLRAIDVRRLFRRSTKVAEPESQAQAEPSSTAFPSFGPASILVRLDAGGGFLGPHRIDVVPARAIEEASS
jgi:Vitamin K-dependent gamma-carboxylase